MTAKAKLNFCAASRPTPRISAVEIVAPDLEKPRNGRQRPCTAPIHVDWETLTAPIEERLSSSLARRSRPAIKMSTPTTARAQEITANCQTTIPLLRVAGRA